MPQQPEPSLLKKSFDRKIRVLLLFDSTFPYQGGGRETGLYHLCKYGHSQLEVRAITLRAPKHAKPQFEDAEECCDFSPVFSWQGLWQKRGYNHFARIFDKSGFAGRAERKASEICKNWSPDAVLCVHAGPLALVALRVAKHYGAISILNMRSLFVDEILHTGSKKEKQKCDYLRKIEKQVIQEIDLVLANGNDTASFCTKKYHRTKPTVTIYNGVDTELFNPKKNIVLRQKLAKNKKFVFVSNNPLRDIKGPQDAIKAFAQLPETLQKESCIWFLGGKGRFDFYRNLAISLGVEEHIQYLGAFPHAELPAYLSAADIAIHPVLFSTGTTHAALETLACGLPLIAYNSASFTTICRTGDTGILVPCGHINGFSDAMLHLASDASLRNTMSQNARKLALEFDWKNFTKRFITPVLEILNPHSSCIGK